MQVLVYSYQDSGDREKAMMCTGVYASIKNDTNKKYTVICKIFTAYSLIIAQNNKNCRQISIPLTKSLHSVSTGHTQARSVLVLTIT